jgi:hypothetical protein
MLDFTKLAAYLDSFKGGDPHYDAACYIKTKLAEDMHDAKTINNAEDEELDDNDVTMATPEQQADENVEGRMMDGVFKEFEVLNKLKEEKEEIKMPDSKDGHGGDNPDVSDESDFGNNASNQKNASLFDILRTKIKR